MVESGRRGREPVDWRLTTWDGARRETLRRWAALPLERIVAALEEMQGIADDAGPRPGAVREDSPARR